MLATIVSVVLAASPAFAATAQVFAPPALSPTSTSTNYTGASTGVITNSPLIAGKSFDRFIQIWLENTDYATAASSPVFQQLASTGILLSGYYGVTHPSQPNYVAVGSGTFNGLHDDNFRAIPSNVSTIVDLLEAGNVSWSSYQESMPYSGYTGFNYTQPNYLNASAGNYTYYVRKHSPLIIHDSVANVSERAMRIRNFNDFATDVNADAISQWSFITPNLVNDAHDTTVDFTGDWLSFWLTPLLANPNFNNNRTVIVITFDETESYSINNKVYTLALGGGIPAHLVNTTDDTYYTHYSTLSTVEANWGLGSLGRGDTSLTMANVFSWVANATGWINNGLLGSSPNIPLTNITGTIPGTLNAEYWVPVLAPNMSAIGAGGGPVFAGLGTNLALTAANAPAPINLTALNIADPQSTNPGLTYINGTLATTAVIASATGTVGGASGSTPASSAAEKLVAPVSGLLALVIALAL